MKILDPQSGATIDTDTWKIREARLNVVRAEKVLVDHPSMYSALAVQRAQEHWREMRKLNLVSSTPRRLDLPRPAELLDPDWDNELGQMVTTIHAGDPGDEI